MDGGSGGGGESQWASWDSSAFCWSVCDDSPPPPSKHSHQHSHPLSICLPSTVVPLPASSSPVDPPSCFLLTRHHVLILAAAFRTADLGTMAPSHFPALPPCDEDTFPSSPSSRTASSGGLVSVRQPWRTTSLLNVAPRGTAAFFISACCSRIPHVFLPFTATELEPNTPRARRWKNNRFQYGPPSCL